MTPTIETINEVFAKIMIGKYRHVPFKSSVVIVSIVGSTVSKVTVARHVGYLWGSNHWQLPKFN